MAKDGVCLNCPDRERQREEKRKTMEVVGYERDKALRLCDLRNMRKKYRKGEKK